MDKLYRLITHAARAHHLTRMNDRYWLGAATRINAQRRNYRADVNMSHGLLQLKHEQM